MVLADTGAIYALLDRDDAWHERVRAWWESSAAEVVLPVTILAEVGYLLGSRVGPKAEIAFAQALAAGEFVVVGLEDEDLPAAARAMTRYADLPLGLVDASILALAQRLEVEALLTTDRRHFGVVRLGRVPLRLVP
jgi:predicted nucleic acid-binding protein